LTDPVPSPTADKNQQEWVRICRNRANTYTLLSRVWGAEVDKSLLQQLRGASFPKLPKFPEMDQAYRRLESALRVDSPDILTELASDFAYLCLGSDPKEGADPFESVHRNRDGLMMQDEWEAVLKLYAELGLGRSEEAHESEDHLALELECLAQLCSRQETALSDGNFPEASWWLDQQVRMLDEHLLLWVPSFVGRVQQMGRTEFYKAFGTITDQYLQIDREVIQTLFKESSTRFE
jgi:TorA maturation chaperone TorD